MKHFITFIAAALFALTAWSHGGEDHSHDAAAPAMAKDIAPRATTQTEDFELVAVLADGKLMLFLDRFASNEPVADAEIEVESGTFKAVAAQLAPGIYALPGGAFANPGKYPLSISVQAGDTADLLSATLDLAQPPAGVEHAAGWDKWATRVAWGASGVLLLAGAGLVAVRRRHRKY